MYQSLRTLTVLVAVSAVLGGTVAAVGPIVDGQQAPGVVAQSTATNHDDQHVDRVDFLEVKSVEDGEYAYRFRVRGYVQKARVNNQLKAESNDDIRRNPDGTMTVVGTTGNGQSDAYLIVGEIVSYQKIRGDSDGELRLNGLELSVDDLLNTDTLEIISQDEDEEVRYRFRVRGTVESVRTDDNIAGDVDDSITSNGDGTVTVQGVTDDQDGDAFRIDGEILSFRKTGGDSRYTLRLDGLEVNPDTLLPGPPQRDGRDGDDDDNGNDADDRDDADNGNGADGRDDGDDGDDQDDSNNGNDGRDTDDSDTTDAVTRLDECTQIDEPGRYVLTGDITNAGANACIEVRASDVVLDGDGHRIDGVQTSETVGIDIAAPEDETLRNVTVRDIEVTEWEVGIHASSRRGGDIADVTLTDVTSRSNMNFGIHTADVERVRVIDATVRANDGTGILLDESGDAAVVLDSVVTDNGGTGIVLFDNSDGGVLRDNVVTNNGGRGIATSNGDRDTIIEENVVTSNDGDGISLSDSTRPVIRRNVIRQNGGAGIITDDARAATIVQNEIAENGEAGMRLEYLSDASIRQNEVQENGDSGIMLAWARDNEVVQNLVCENGGIEEIVVGEDAEGNVIEGNRLSC